MRYVKVCPRCGAENDEMAEVCARDNEFLGMVPATPARPPAPPPAQASPAPAAAAAPRSAGPVLYLDCAGSDECLAVRPGWVMGQEYPGSTAELQLSPRPGVQFVHRRHCRFHYDNGLWEVEALAQPEYTNPTRVNRVDAAPGARVALRNGDQLSLAGLSFTVRMIQP
ncbi:MAG: FHA domain-containing protein [Candidatus Hydrogenedens sp.]|nr:FHA domain-containing protein [Candidatus Hydrogenedentota bacterium]NLF58669.1 FHA domain-containing protein [Candidatus Hydrogenedens sp.]